MNDARLPHTVLYLRLSETAENSTSITRQDAVVRALAAREPDGAPQKSSRAADRGNSRGPSGDVARRRAPRSESS